MHRAGASRYRGPALVRNDQQAYPILVGEGTAQRVPRLDQPHTVLKPLGSFLLASLRQGTKVYTPKHSMQATAAAEQANLEYLKHKSFST